MNWPILTAILFTIHKICCLKDPSIQANGLKSFMICNAAYFCIILRHFVHHFSYFLATYALNSGIHHYTVSICTPMVSFHVTKIIQSYNNPKSLPARDKKTSTVFGFILYRTDIVNSSRGIMITCQSIQC